MPDKPVAEPELPVSEIPIPVKAYLGPIILEIPAKPAQVAIVVRMATQELISAGIITMGGQPSLALIPTDMDVQRTERRDHSKEA